MMIRHGILEFVMMGGMILFWTLIIVLAVVLVKKLFNSGGNQAGDNASKAKQILDERYAKGEITREQYQEMLKDIR